MPGATADAVNDILRGVMEPGGFGQNIAIDKPSAGKTGTNNSNMAGVVRRLHARQLATAAMVAGANEFGEWVTLNGQTVGGSYISSAFGSTVAGPIWGEAMAASSAKLPYEDFQAPPGDEIAGVLTHGARRGRPDASRPRPRRSRPPASPSPTAARSTPRSARAWSPTPHPRAARQLSSGDTVDALHLDRLRAPAAVQQRRQGRRQGQGAAAATAADGRPLSGVSPAACAPRPPRHRRRHDP